MIIAEENNEKGEKKNEPQKLWWQANTHISIYHIRLRLVIRKALFFRFVKEESFWKGSFVTLGQNEVRKYIFHFAFEWNVANK